LLGRGEAVDTGPGSSRSHALPLRATAARQDLFEDPSAAEARRLAFASLADEPESDREGSELLVAGADLAELLTPALESEDDPRGIDAEAVDEMMTEDLVETL
jgi:hypothetical protein